MLGTGAMGAGMARSLKRAGMDVVAWNRTKSKAEPLADDGIEVAGSVADAVAGADVVVTMVFDLDAVLALQQELIGALGPDAIWVQSATVGPSGTERIAGQSGDARLLDAPVVGTKEPAEQGKLVYLVSGPAELVERARPVLEAMSSKVVVAGEKLGDASALKLVCNAWVLSLTAATAQSVVLAERFGVGGRTFLDTIKDGPSDTPYAQLKGGMMLGGEGFPSSFALDGGRKDLGLIIDAASGADVDTAVLDAVSTVYASAAEKGHGDDDVAAVITGFTKDD